MCKDTKKIQYGKIYFLEIIYFAMWENVCTFAFSTSKPDVVKFTQIGNGHCARLP